MQYLSHILFALLVAMQAADAFLTWRILRAGGTEKNRFLAALMLRIGVPQALALTKLVMVLAIGVLLRFAPVPGQLLALGILVLVYAWVVRHNWRQLFKPGAEA